MGEIMKLRRKSTGQTRTVTEKGYNLLSERDKKKWEVISGTVPEETKKKVVVGAAKNEPTFDSTEVTVTGEPSKGGISHEIKVPADAFVDMSESEAKTEESDEELSSLREQYRNLSQKEPKGNWKVKRLQEEIKSLTDAQIE